MKIDYNKPIDFDKIDDLSVIDENKLDSRARVQYRKALKARSVAEASLRKSNERAEAVQSQLRAQHEKPVINEISQPAQAKPGIKNSEPAPNENKQKQESKVNLQPVQETETEESFEEKPPVQKKTVEFPRYVGVSFDELTKAIPADEARVFSMKLDEDMGDELDDQARRRRKEPRMTSIMKVGLQIVLEMPDKEYADLKLRAQSENKSVGTVVHEALSKYLYEK